MNRHRSTPALLACLAVVLLAACPNALAKGHSHKRSATISLTGTVTKVTPKRRSFSLKTTGGPTVRVSVGKRTKGVRLRGLKRGLALTVRARHDRRGWVASRIAKRVVPSASDKQNTNDTSADDTEDTQDIDDVSTDDTDTPVDGDVSNDGFPADDDGSDDA